ncbi:MAG: universal stress protein UspA [Muricauda sp.]|nr:universal stress protein [Allomuricauda sp.]MBC32260.1 universal stress protein UspA [Allomuricauda sp.]|tara:strand:+ start:33555 stop:34346 length:792 start_codon:yes stop_codon:yes gene_type:complete
MSSITKILVPFDFTEASIAALDYTLSFVGFNRPIQVQALYVSSSALKEADLKETQDSFDRVVGSLNRRTMKKPELLMVQGELIASILRTRTDQQADLIIMGTLGDKSADEHLTNTSQLVLEADCPVMAVPFGSEIKTPKEIALVLGKEEIENPRLLSMLLHIARMFNAKVHVLTIYKESIYEENTVVESNEDTLEYYLEHFYAEHTFEKNQDIEKGILDYIKEKDIDLLTILPRNHAQKTKPSEGRLTKLLTLHSSVPVLTLD